MTEQRESTRGLVPWPGPVIPTPEQIEQAAAILGITGVSLWNMLFGPPPVVPPPPPPAPPPPGPIVSTGSVSGLSVSQTSGSISPMTAPRGKASEP